MKIKVKYTHNNSVARIILDDGKGNVLDNIMMNELIQVLNSFNDKNDIKLITFEGAGKHFSFGANVEEHKKENAALMLKTFHSIFYSILNLSIPTLAKISGQCLGGGMELALVCNFMFADKSAVFGQPEIMLGVFPPPASVMLPLKIGNTAAENILITGNTFTAKKGKEIGLINEVFENKETMEALIAAANEHEIKTVIHIGSWQDAEEAVLAGATALTHTMGRDIPDQLIKLLKTKRCFYDPHTYCA